MRLKPCDGKGDVSLIAASPTSLVFSNLAEGPDANFEFDGVLGEGAGQASVFSAVSHIVQAVVEGHNGTIMTYGQVNFSTLAAFNSPTHSPVHTRHILHPISRI